MKLQIKVIEAGPTNSLSLWGGDSGHAGGVVKAGDEFTVEGASVSISGGDGVGANPVATADNAGGQD